ncbi:PREDICTED: uncharacterized protein LOC100633923 [Amphimedon queenslandica]|uniref:F-box domain-containing protein n=1 Tax=Amphimedon queenslandica TaxID=400682 RepID=A0AAN0K4X3_AMPQE|nr:PREDICTED: uncharacterized protein LOC100633923 [Amphimedon queenslandica]|eukprot:XP_019864265.1 PREDICTED: uncharacterized protein LOC100633923 [Amphimedon queenslandica]
MSSISSFLGSKSFLESSTLSSDIFGTDASLRMSLEVKQYIKKISNWYKGWHRWQRRIVICRMVEHCSTPHLQILSTSLEPVLHLDFANSLNPLMAALHQEGSHLFKIQRAAVIRDSADVKKQRPKPPIQEKTKEMIMGSSRKMALSRLTPKKEKPAPPHVKAGEAMFNKEMNSTGARKVKEKQQTQVFFPALPLSHTKHKPSPASSDKGHHFTSLPPIERKFNSVPNITVVNSRHGGKIKPARHHPRAITLQHTKDLSSQQEHWIYQKKRLEAFKLQLNMISEWMTESGHQDISYLLLELIKLCDEELLGYLVQCVYQKLQAHIGLNSFPDHILLKIFSFLDAPNLCKCALVCHRWYNLTSKQELWRGQVAALGYRENIGNLVRSIEAVRNYIDGSTPRPRVVIDWKRAYRDLLKLMSRIKTIVINKTMAVLEQEKEKKEEMILRSLTPAQLRATMTLREMLEIARFASGVSGKSSREILLSAPESTITQWRREKRERLEMEAKLSFSAIVAGNKSIESSATDKDIRVTCTTTTLSDESYYYDTYDPGKMSPVLTQRNSKKKIPLNVIPLVECATDIRPTVPSLPNPDGIESLILAGYLSPKDRPRPGRVKGLSFVDRIAPLGTSVLCVQCDERKIVAGCADRLIRIYDIRSGRFVALLEGHTGSVQCVQFDENKIVSGSWDTNCIVWDAIHFVALKTLGGHTDCVSCLQFHETILVTGSHDQTLKIWDTPSWLCLRTISNAHSQPITCLFFNGLTIISGSEDSNVNFWNVHTAENLGSLEHYNGVTSLKLSKLLLVTACIDGMIYLWNVTTHGLLMQWSLESDIIIVDICVDRGKVYAAASDGVIHEWDIATGACVRMLKGHCRPLTALWVGNYKIVSAAEDQSLCVWQPEKPPVQGEEGIEKFYSFVPVKTVML